MINALLSREPVVVNREDHRDGRRDHVHAHGVSLGNMRQPARLAHRPRAQAGGLSQVVALGKTRVDGVE
jgi:predicted ABC-type transport system involved in lysophospholipase L1 biosynthesis ATPase subunit